MRLYTTFNAIIIRCIKSTAIESYVSHNQRSQELNELQINTSIILH